MLHRPPHLSRRGHRASCFAVALAVLLQLMLLAWSGAAHALTDADKDAIALLLLGPKDNPVKACATSALRLNLGLSMQLMGKSSDEQVRANLVDTLTEPTLRSLAEEEYALWARNHRPDQVAEMEFHGCLARSNMDLRNNLGPAGPTCFNFMAVPATAETYKLLKQPREATLERLRARFGQQVSAEAIEQVTEQVYAGNAATDEVLAHRQAFVACVRSSQ